MEHVAIMNKKWGMIEKIISGRKTIESRWYIQRGRRPRVGRGDMIYFRNSGEPVTAKAEVADVVLCDDLTLEKVNQLLGEYGEGIGIERSEIDQYKKIFQDKKIVLLIFLSNPKKIMPFEVDKSKAGYCSRAAWVTVPDVRKIVK